MRILVLAMLVIVLLAEYIQGEFGLPREITWLPEVLSLLAAACVALIGTKSRFKGIDARYIAIFGLLLLHVALGVIANGVSSGVLFAGIRVYLKSLPFFFLPLVVTFKDRDLRLQFWLIAAIAVVQLPIAWQQKNHTQYIGLVTGDYTTGTLVGPAFLSTFLACTASVATAMHLKGRLSMSRLALFLILTLPATMINETKASLVLLPVAILLPALLAGPKAGSPSFKRIALAVTLVVGFVAAFIPMYDQIMKPRYGYGIVEFFEMEGRISNYLVKDSEIGSEKSGKVDSLLLPFKAAKGDLAQIFFGLGIGNVTESSLGREFTGKYFYRYGALMGPTASLLLWEIGCLGLLLVGCLYYLIWRDSLVARQEESVAGALALGWTGVVCVMFIAMFYKVTIASNALSYLFWFYSGVVAAAALRVRAGSQVPARPVIWPRNDTQGNPTKTQETYARQMRNTG
jgi:hypothetical protein